MNPPTAPARTDHDARVYRMMLWTYITVLPAAALFFLTAGIADSATLYLNFAWYAIDFAIQTFCIYTIRQSMQHNTDRFSYGTGKLENFSAFLDGAFCIPVGLYLGISAAGLLFAPVPVGYAVGMIPVLIIGLRVGILYYVCERLMRETAAPSPILQSYTIAFRVSLFTNLGILVAFLAGLVLDQAGLPAIGNRIDPLITILMSLYLAFAGIRLVRQNFRSLIDLPLPEDERLRVLKVMAAFFHDYDGLGTIYTRTSGRERIVELELFFPPEKTLAEIHVLQAEMEEALAAELPGLRFRIIPGIRK